MPTKLSASIILKIIFGAVFVITTTACSNSSSDDGFVSIFDGETLDGWIVNRFDEAPEGLSEDEIFTVDDVGIHVYAGAEQGSHQARATLVSEKEYSRFVLEFEYRWGDARFAPRADVERDAGFLFHIHGDIHRVWPSCLEMQMGTSPLGGEWVTGDLWVLGNSKVSWQSTPIDRPRRIETKRLAEKPLGDWNLLRVTVDGANSAVFELNDTILLDGISDFTVRRSGEPLEKGRVGVQAEWAELWYRNIRIKEL